MQNIMVYYFDIDGTICTMSKNLNYEEAQPIKDRIHKVNELYNLGHTIIWRWCRNDDRST